MKTILMASMIIALAVMPIQSNALAISPSLTDRVEDSTMVDFLNDLIETGSSTKTKTLDDSTVVTITNNVQKLSENTYQVQIIGTENDKTMNEQTIIVTQNANGSVNMVNEKLGYNVDFHKTQVDNALQNGINETKVSYTIGDPQPLGSGSSNGSGARIDLYDSDWRSADTTVLYLSDSYSGCVGGNAADISATVFTTWTNTVWNSNALYWDWCVNPHSFDRLDITHEGTTHYYTGSDRSSSETYNHSGGTGTFSVDVNVYYGSW